MAVAAIVIGKVASIQGVAFAKSQDGTLRQLKLGDPVFEGEVIQTEMGAHVELQLNDGSFYALRDQESVTVDGMLFDNQKADPKDGALFASSADTDQIAKAIAEGNSLDELLEETAAGATTGGGNDGHSFVRLLRISEAITPVEFDYGIDGNGTTGRTLGSEVVNTPPVATPDAYITDEDQPLTVALPNAVLANDLDADGDKLTVNTTPITDVAHGTLSLNADGTFTYVPNRNFNGVDSFVYEVLDGKGGTAQTTVTITVNPVNDAPVAGTVAVNPDGSTTADANSVGAGNYAHTIDEDTSVSGQVRATDVDGDTLTYAQASNPANGTVVVNADGSYLYTPNLNFNGTDSFTVLVADGQGGTTVSTVTITVTPVQDASIITAGSGSVTEDTTLTTSGRLSIRDVDGVQDEQFTVQNNVAGAHGTFSIDSNGNWTYNLNNSDPAVQALNPGQTMTEVFNVTGVDGTSSMVTVVINGVSENIGPVAGNDTVTTAMDVPVAIDVLANDSDPNGDSLSIVAFGQGTSGTVALVSGKLVYTPSTGFTGTDSFTYTISDGKGGVDTATVTVGVGVPVDLPPVANPDSATTAAGAPVTINVLANDTDPEGKILTVTAVSVPAAQGDVVLNSDGTITFTPAAGFSGNATISYSISDGTNTASSTATVGVGAPVDMPPVANPDSASTAAGTPVTIDVLANDTDPEGKTLTVTAVSVPAVQGDVVLNSDGTITFTPAAGFSGNATISYNISDGASTASSTVTVAAV